MKKTDLNIQFGAGWSAAEGWLNFDSSPSVWLQRLPLVGQFIRVDGRRFPENILYGDIVRGLPVAPASAKAAYASHVLEHLSYSDCLAALKNTFKILRPGGVFRLVVPCLRARILQYTEAKDVSNAAHQFCRSTLLGTETRPKNILGRIRDGIGNSRHLWMWDEDAMKKALHDAGFKKIRRCEFGDALDEDFKLVESYDRFHDASLGIEELAIEAIKITDQ